MTTACELFGHTRQAWYQKNERSIGKCLIERTIIDFVKSVREEDPGIGGKKLWLMGKSVYDDSFIGRDAFLELLRRSGLCLKRPKPRYTTNSNHRYHKYKNLIMDFIPVGPNMLWVSDITYIKLADGKCCYLHLVTDAYSRKVVGWCLSPTLEAKYTLDALRQAIEQAEGYDLSQLIHHSDRGVQYCCDMYVNELNRYNVRISMTEDYKPTDNGIAERVNGIIKNEKLYRIPLYKSIEEAKKGIGDFIRFYNERRPHMSISYKTPSEAHLLSGEQERAWR